MEFQSTLSVRRATLFIYYLVLHLCISIHALRKESDAIKLGRKGMSIISIHALRKESDRCADDSIPSS